MLGIISGLMFIILSSLGISVEARTLADPFLNPIILKEVKLLQNKIKMNSAPMKKVQIGEQEANLFKAVLPRPFEELKIEGVISVNGVSYLVLSDPKTGETFLLKKGDAISSSEKLLHISSSKIVIEKYIYLNGKLKRKTYTLKVHSEG